MNFWSELFVEVDGGSVHVKMFSFGGKMLTRRSKKESRYIPVMRQNGHEPIIEIVGGVTVIVKKKSIPGDSDRTNRRRTTKPQPQGASHHRRNVLGTTAVYNVLHRRKYNKLHENATYRRVLGRTIIPMTAEGAPRS